MSGYSLPPRVTPQSIDALFEESDEDQCLDTESEEKSERALSPAEMTEIAKLLSEIDVF